MPAVTARTLVTLCALGAAVAACSDQARLPTTVSGFHPAFDASRATLGTTLEVTKTAAGFFERRLDYDWSIRKRVKDVMDETPEGQMYMLPSATDIKIPRQQVRWIEYEITADRKPGTVQLVSGVRGQICVTNTGTAPTSGLSIVDVVQVKRGSDHYVNYKEVPLALDDKQVLQPGESHCYAYDILLDRVSGASYRNAARVTITNYRDHEGAYGPCDDDEGDKGSSSGRFEVKPVSFSLPSIAAEGPPMDADAVVHDGMPVDNRSDRTGPCAEHFYMYWCTTNTAKDEYHLAGSGTIEYIVDMHNFFGCGDSFDLPNEAELVEGGKSGSGMRRHAHASIHITSDDCEPEPHCVDDAKHWAKARLWPDETPEHSFIRHEFEFFDSHKTWQQALESENQSVYFALARQYIGANLNRANRAAMPGDVRSAFASTAHYFSLAPNERGSTPQQSLHEWEGTLESYNKGVHGVPRCPDNERDHDKDRGDKDDDGQS